MWKIFSVQCGSVLYKFHCSSLSLKFTCLEIQFGYTLEKKSHNFRLFVLCSGMSTNTNGLHRSAANVAYLEGPVEKLTAENSPIRDCLPGWRCKSTTTEIRVRSVSLPCCVTREPRSCDNKFSTCAAKRHLAIRSGQWLKITNSHRLVSTYSLQLNCEHAPERSVAASRPT
jgi:hypothetical protein